MAQRSIARRDRLWLEAVDRYFLTPQEIADMCNVSVRTVYYGLKRARGQELDFQTIWDIEWRTTPNAFTETTQCEQHAWQDIPKGLAVGCLACLRTGLDHLIRQPTTREREHGELEKPPDPEPTKSYAQQKFGGRGLKRQERLEAEAKAAKEEKPE